jgi:diguanylate cyclase (GGDEF)-like protein
MPISQRLLQSASLNKWTLRFKNERLESLYRHHTLPGLRRQARIALLVGAIIYGLYGFLDSLFVPPEAVIQVWYIRTMVIMLAFAVFALTFYKRFGRLNQLLLVLAGFFGGLGLLAKMWLLPTIAISYYFAGLILVTFWCHCFAGLRFINATWVGIWLLAIFNFMFLWVRPLPILSVISADFFIVSANLFCAFSSYMSETQNRSLFLREKELDRERRLQHERALHDRLTGLPNRELLMDRIEQAINYSTRNDQICAGFFLDLDRFKPINDTYGHAVGDLVLQEVSNRFRRVMRETDTLSRLGGDEFFVLARDIQTEGAAEALARKLQQQLDIPLLIRNLAPITDLSASIGICIFPYKNVTAIDVVRRADQAMYQVKHGTRGGVALAPA